MSTPETKVRPAPAMTIALTPGSAPASSIALRSAAIVAPFSALTGGLSMRTTRTPPTRDVVTGAFMQVVYARTDDVTTDAGGGDRSNGERHRDERRARHFA